MTIKMSPPWIFRINCHFVITLIKEKMIMVTRAIHVMTLIGGPRWVESTCVIVEAAGIRQ